MAIVTFDWLAIGEIGNDHLGKVRARIHKERAIVLEKCGGQRQPLSREAVCQRRRQDGASSDGSRQTNG